MYLFDVPCDIGMSPLEQLDLHYSIESINRLFSKSSSIDIPELFPQNSPSLDYPPLQHSDSFYPPILSPSTLTLENRHDSIDPNEVCLGHLPSFLAKTQSEEEKMSIELPFEGGGVIDMAGVDEITDMVGVGEITDMVGVGEITDMMGVNGMTDMAGVNGMTDMAGVNGITDITETHQPPTDSFPLLPSLPAGFSCSIIPSSSLPPLPEDSTLNPLPHEPALPNEDVESSFDLCEWNDQQSEMEEEPDHKEKKTKQNHTWEETALQLQLNVSVPEMSEFSIPGKST